MDVVDTGVENIFFVWILFLFGLIGGYDFVGAPTLFLSSSEQYIFIYTAVYNRTNRIDKCTLRAVLFDSFYYLPIHAYCYKSNRIATKWHEYVLSIGV